MQAVTQHRYGTEDDLVIGTVAVPELAAGEVLIRVRAVALHIGDWHLTTGTPYLMRILGFGLRGPKQTTRGSDVAGTIDEVGSDVTEFAVGDPVFGVCAGALADFATAVPDDLVHKPSELGYDAAAALATSGCTALQAVRSGDIRSGQQVLIIGASGGVGLYAVQLASHAGATVTAVCSTAKHDLVRAAGAAHTLAYTGSDIAGIVRRYDVILDLAGNRSLARLRQLLTPVGTLVIIGGEDGGRVTGGMGRSIHAALLSRFTRQQLRMLSAKVTASDLAILRELAATSDLRPIIDRRYHLTETADALARLHSGRSRGKIIIAPSGDRP